jgi:hypothetical protein
MSGMTTIGQVYRWHRPLVAFAFVMAALAVVAAVGVFVDDRVLGGVPIWLKPLKFAISLTVYGPTLAWMISLLRRGRRFAWWSGTVVAVALVIEMIVIVAQVIRGRHSHFDVATPLDTTLWVVMGASIGVLWLANLVIAVLLLSDRVADQALNWAVRLSMVVMLGGLGVGFLMTQPTPEQQRGMSAGLAPTLVGGHSVGVEDGGPAMWLTGWSTTGGDLRIPHFVGIHALQALPLLVLLLRRFPAPVQLRLVFVAAGTYAGLVGLVLWQALRGQPLIHPDGLTLSVLAGLLAVAGTAAALVTRRSPAPAVV